jgi:2-polyprenyl-3-methyl-5-hydroxy-6-metoxy-1,4-benzoquinol methylase
MESAPLQCWCGNTELAPFSPGYRKCPACETLVTTHAPNADIAQIASDEEDFYGRSYWFSHQENDLGSINIIARARSDLPERCVYWLRTLLKYQLPPARALELGCGHGGCVALMRWLGFDAVGLELSPWVVEFASKSFDIPVLLGKVEDQSTILPGTLDLIVLIDVLEHLIDPVHTLRHCLDLLAHDGILLIQTPCYPEGMTYQELLDQQHLFLKMLVPDEHIYLFSKSAAREFFDRLGAEHVLFEPPMASHDMFFLVSRAPLEPVPADQREQLLSSNPQARLVRALLDKAQQMEQVIEYSAAKERDLSVLQDWVSENDHTAEAQVAAVAARLSTSEQYAVSLRAELESVTEYAATLQQARQHDHAINEAYTNSLRETLAAREADLANAEAHIHSLQEVLNAREAELASAKAYLTSMHQQLNDLEIYARSLEAMR